MKNRPNKVIRASKKKPNKAKADDLRQDPQSKASTKRGVREAEEWSGQSPPWAVVAATATSPGCFGFSRLFVFHAIFRPLKLRICL